MRSRKIVTLLTAAVALLALSGCMRLHQDVALQSDDTVNGTIIIAYEVAFLELAGLSEDDVEGLLTEQGLGDLSGDFGDNLSITDYDQGGYTGIQMEFTAMPLADFQAEAGFTFSRVEDEFIVEADFSSLGVDTAEIPANMLASMDMRTSVTFPGGVIEQRGGEVTENTVTWVVNFANPGEVYARGHAAEGGEGPSALLLIVGGSVLVLLLVSVVALVLTRKGRAAVDPIGAGSDPELGNGALEGQPEPGLGQGIYGAQPGYEPASPPSAHPEGPGPENTV